MTITLPSDFTFAHRQTSDRELRFLCPTDAGVWPWLSLPPEDPIVVQALNYYATYETAKTLGLLSDGQWSALTGTRWRCGKPGAGHAASGVLHHRHAGGRTEYRFHFHDEAGELVYEMSCAAVVFKNRDFKSWRESQAPDLGAPVPLADFAFAGIDALGFKSPIECYVSPLRSASPPAASALITAENGFPPAHPYHDGSGDHVNAAHLADAVRQFLRLVAADANLVVRGADFTFRRFVELNHPFDLSLDASDSTADEVSVAITQAGNTCATARLDVGPGDWFGQRPRRRSA